MNHVLWGALYRILVKKVAKLTPDLASRGHEEEIADRVFPVHLTIDWSTFSKDLPTTSSEQSPPPFTADDLREMDG